MRQLLAPFLFITFMACGSGCKPPVDPNAAAQNEPEAEATGEMERVKAEVGVGKQGQVIVDKEGFLRTPAKALFTTRQRVVFDIQIPQALALYDAEHGFKPKTHEEFMSKIIEFNKIALPELPAGQTYIWDPDSAQLMVEKPKQ